jgi:hypothetical protein
MTDDTGRPLDPTPPPADAPGTDPGGSHEPGVAPDETVPGGEPKSPEAHEWLSQLQTMIDRIAGEAAPVARDVAAKAAELAAVAGEKAGPFARRAAEVTEDVGIRVAARSRQLADDLRHRGAESGLPPVDVDADADAGPPPAPGAEVADAPPAATDKDAPAG